MQKSISAAASASDEQQERNIKIVCALGAAIHIRSRGTRNLQLINECFKTMNPPNLPLPKSKKQVLSLAACASSA